MISCAEYDTIEMVCMYQYPIKLIIKSGITLEGVAIDTKRNKNREECILLNVNDVLQLIKLDDIVQLNVCIENPHVNQITFK